MDKIFHLLAIYRSVFRVRAVIGAIAVIFCVFWIGATVYCIDILKHAEIQNFTRFVILLTVLLTAASGVAASYFWTVKSLNRPLKENTIKKLSSEVIEHYKNEMNTCNLRAPITWADLYFLLKYMEEQAHIEYKNLQDYDTLAKQKVCIKDIV